MPINQDSSELVMIDKDQLYEVEKIVDKRLNKGKAEYQVKWKFWDDPKDMTWQPEQNLCTVKELICEFERHYKKVPPRRAKTREKVNPPISRQSRQMSIQQAQSPSHSEIQHSRLKRAKKQMDVPPEKQENISSINYVIYYQGKFCADCDIRSNRSDCVGASLVPIQAIQKSSPKMLAQFLQKYLIEIVHD